MCLEAHRATRELPERKDGGNFESRIIPSFRVRTGDILLPYLLVCDRILLLTIVGVASEDGDEYNHGEDRVGT